METLWQDIRYGVRMLVRNPGFAAVAVLTLALGIGASTAVFSVADTVLFRPLPFADSDRLIQIQRDPCEDTLWIGLPYRLARDLAEQTRSFEAVAILNPARFQLQGAEFPELAEGFRVSANLFSMLGIKPLLGRTFLPGEDRTGNDNVVVVGYGLWQRWFDGDPNLLGKSVSVDGRLSTVVGVMPPRFQFIARPYGCEMWRPYVPGPDKQDQWDTLFAIARLKDSVSLEQAQVETTLLVHNLAQEYPEAYRKQTIHLRPVRAMARCIRGSFWPLIGAVAFVLLIACANVANLLLARMASRENEAAIRAALGASRWRVIRLALTESLLLALLGACLGLLFAHWGVGLLTPLIPRWLPVAKQISVDGRMVACALFMLAVTGVGCGLAPAWYSCKTDLTGALKEGGIRSVAGPGRKSFRQFLVVCEVALALMLFIGAGLMIQTVVRLLRVDPGFDPRNLLEFRIELPQTRHYGSAQVLVERYKRADQRRVLYERVLECLKALPGVQSVGAVSMPQSDYTAEGQTTPLWARHCRCSVGAYDYLRAIGVRLLQGRHFAAEDLSGMRDKVIINEAAARQFWPGQNPIGKRLQGMPQRSPWLTVVGVVATSKLEGYAYGAWREVYTPSMNAPCEHFWEYVPGSARFVVRTSVDPLGLINVIRRELAAVDMDLRVSDFAEMEDRLLRSTARERLYMQLLTSFAVVGLTLAAAGVYGVISYSVAQCTHEIGIRMALGARSSDVFRLVIKKGLALIVVGLVIGVAGALALTRVLRSFLYGVSPTDPVTFALVCLLLAVVGLIACYIPARRAAKVDPMVALRYE
jgi:predicted permease